MEEWGSQGIADRYDEGWRKGGCEKTDESEVRSGLWWEKSGLDRRRVNEFDGCC